MGIGLLFIWLLFGIVAGSIAQTKGYSGCLWTLAGFLLGPFAIIAIAFMAAKPRDELGTIDARDFQPCPFCQEPVRQTAIKCKHCGSSLS
jgi:hypothetical protein